MSQSIKQIIFLALFFSLVGITVVLRAYQPATPQAEPFDREAALKRYGFCFEEVSKACGINFMHTAPTLDDRLSHIMPIIASMGASVSVVDFDRDGWPDLYVVNSGEGSRNALYRNNHDGTFEDVADKMGVADLNR